MMDVDDLLRKLHPLRPRQVEQWRSVLRVADTDVRSLVERQIRITATQLFGANLDRKILLSLPPREQSKGAVALGTILYDREKWPFALTTEELLQNLSIFGRSGAGKTNVVFGILQQLSAKRIPCLFLDWKRTARHLAPFLQADCRVFTPGRSLAPFPFNPLMIPPGTERDVYLLHVVDVLAQAYTLGDGAKSILHHALESCYRQTRAPTFSELLAAVDAMETKERATGWKISARRAVESVVFATGRTDAESQQELAKNLLRRTTIVELDGLSANAKKFLIPLLCYWVYSVRLSSSTREQLKYVIVCEEAHHTLYRQEQRSTESLMNVLLRQGRELGIAVIVVDQHPHLISAAALGNCYTTICLNLKDTSDLTKAAGLSLLKDSEKRLFSLLPVGQGVVKLQDRFTEPFLVKFPRHPLQKGSVTDAMLVDVYRGKTSWSAIRERLGTATTAAAHSRLGVSHVDEGGAALLHDVALHPQDGVDARYRRLGVSASQGNRLKQQLVENGLVSPERVQVGRTYRVLLRLTDEAQQLMIAGPGRDPQASFLHEYWKRVVAKRYEARGYAVTLERPRTSGNGNIDILATRGSESVAIEIETGRSNVVSNVKRDLLEGVDRVHVVATDEQALRTVEGQLARVGLLLPNRVQLTLRDAED